MYISEESIEILSFILVPFKFSYWMIVIRFLFLLMRIHFLHEFYLIITRIRVRSSFIPKANLGVKITLFYIRTYLVISLVGPF